MSPIGGHRSRISSGILNDNNTDKASTERINPMSHEILFQEIEAVYTLPSFGTDDCN
ncbi:MULTISPECIES: hypothetical protein [unclassified Mycobacterium]|uniref:hypothetical protein n=1 Tax=unclassified Mycobacterium TaxID=2642494 RepID=UPI00269DE118|nr:MULTISPECIES: hypothetical protein [unclassified Mycobacterium]MDP7703710.1 hypothetical protein [Mycobacterium sp. TY815]MDP7722192.1 hypothetical protein [Mycobacterium sp. TY814]